LVVWLGENPLVAEVPIAARIRLRQVTLAVPTLTDEGDVVFADNAKSSKYDALKEIIDDNPNDAMLILTDSQKYAKLVTDSASSHQSGVVHPAVILLAIARLLAVISATVHGYSPSGLSVAFISSCRCSRLDI